jgi:hypothetical protein
MGDKV